MRKEQQVLDRALSLHHQGKISDAARLYRRIINTNPSNLHALHFLGVAEAATGNINRAKSLLDRSLQSNPVNPEFIENYAAVLHRAGDYDALIRLHDHFKTLVPGSLGLLHAGAAALSAQGRYADAISELKQLLAHHPDHFPAHFMLGSCLAKTRQYDAAIESYDRALQLNPRLAEAHLDKGTIHFANRRFESALSAYDQAIATRPDIAEAWLGRGFALLQLARHDEALAAIDDALSRWPGFTEAWVGRGNVFLQTDRPLEAAAAYDRALAINQNHAAAWTGHGNAFLKTGRHREAAAAFDRALAVNPTSAEAWLGRGTLLLLQGRHDEALTAIDTALAADPDLSQAWLARGQVSYLGRRYSDALDDWTRSLDLAPDQPGVAAACLRARLHLCDWTAFDETCASVRSSVQAGKLVSPFMFVAIPSTAAEQLQCARRWIDHNFLAFGGSARPANRSDHDRIRVAYLSADFHEHATSRLMAGIFEHHDRSRFQITGISVGPDDSSAMRRRIAAAFESFVEARTLGDDQIADMIRALEVDILVDLKGFTQDGRTGVFAMRPAPIQVSYLGFPGTLGAGFVDYLIADRQVIEKEDFACYAEKIAWLPTTYQANDRARTIAEPPSSRAEHGLPDEAFVFCCFNDNYKIMPITFASWMRILLAVDNAVLWLFADNPKAADNLRREARATGVDPERLVFARRASNADHLERYRRADLFLDTLPYGAHTTASDALWAGLPVLSCRGETFAGRVGTSLLHAIEMPELITTTAAEYEALAIGLAQHPDRLAALRTKLARNRLTTPLFDTAQTTGNLETAYVLMMERHQAGLPPDHIRVHAS